MWTFNPNQLSTLPQARELAIRLSQGPIIVGNGVRSENSNNLNSGIYRPDWLSGPGAFPEPNWTDPKTGESFFYYHFRFNNGAEGMNVGLILDKFRRYPNSPFYVLRTLAEEAASMAK